MISIRKCPKESVVHIKNVEYDGETIYFYLSGDVEAQVRLTHEEVATHLGYQKNEIRVEYGDSGEDYIIEFILDGHTFTNDDYLDNHIEVATTLLRNRIFEKYSTQLQ